jgi:hypothetical protein
VHHALRRRRRPENAAAFLGPAMRAGRLARAAGHGCRPPAAAAVSRSGWRPAGRLTTPPSVAPGNVQADYGANVASIGGRCPPDRTGAAGCTLAVTSSARSAQSPARWRGTRLARAGARRTIDYGAAHATTSSAGSSAAQRRRPHRHHRPQTPAAHRCFVGKKRGRVNDVETSAGDGADRPRKDWSPRATSAGASQITRSQRRAAVSCSREVDDGRVIAVAGDEQQTVTRLRHRARGWCPEV